MAPRRTVPRLQKVKEHLESLYLVFPKHLPSLQFLFSAPGDTSQQGRGQPDRMQGTKDPGERLLLGQDPISSTPGPAPLSSGRNPRLGGSAGKGSMGRESHPETLSYTPRPGRTSRPRAPREAAPCGVRQVPVAVARQRRVAAAGRSPARPERARPGPAPPAGPGSGTASR